LKGIDFRIIASLNYTQKTCYFIGFRTHKEYDMIDASKISFDTNILNSKI
jgi:mRNA interferase HigB